jgi:hypothetical protein
VVRPLEICALDVRELEEMTRVVKVVGGRLLLTAALELTTWDERCVALEMTVNEPCVAEDTCTTEDETGGTTDDVLEEGNKDDWGNADEGTLALEEILLWVDCETEEICGVLLLWILEILEADGLAKRLEDTEWMDDGAEIDAAWLDAREVDGEPEEEPIVRDDAKDKVPILLDTCELATTGTDETVDTEMGDARFEDADCDADPLNIFLPEVIIEENTALLDFVLDLTEGSDVKAFELECPEIMLPGEIGADEFALGRTEDELTGFELRCPDTVIADERVTLADCADDDTVETEDRGNEVIRIVLGTEEENPVVDLGTVEGRDAKLLTGIDDGTTDKWLLPGAELEATLDIAEDFAETDEIEILLLPFAVEEGMELTIRLDGTDATDEAWTELLALKLVGNTDRALDNVEPGERDIKVIEEMTERKELLPVDEGNTEEAILEVDGWTERGATIEDFILWAEDNADAERLGAMLLDGILAVDWPVDSVTLELERLEILDKTLGRMLVKVDNKTDDAGLLRDEWAWELAWIDVMLRTKEIGVDESALDTVEAIVEVTEDGRL